MRTDRGGYQWMVRLDNWLRPDVTTVVRTDATNEAALDYLLQALDVRRPKVRLQEDNGIFDAFYFIAMGERAEVVG